MRKYYLFVLVLILSIILSSCSLTSKSKNSTDQDSSLVNAVKQIEEYDYKLNNFQITYDDYKKNTQMFMASGYSTDDIVIFIDNNKQYTGKDLIGMPLSELKALGNKIETQVFGNTTLKEDTLSISGVYKDASSPFRYVFTKETKDLGNLGITLYKKYTFTKEGNGWKIISIDQEPTSNNNPSSYGVGYSPYSSYNNKPVSYTQSINLLK